MFVRKRKNKSGTVSVHIVDKSKGVYKMVKSVGSAQDQIEIEQLVKKAEDELLPSYEDQMPLFCSVLPGDVSVKNFVGDLENSNIRTIGPELIFGTFFDRVGFDAIKDELFRHLVVARLAYPTSKLKTVDYLYRYQGTVTQEDAIYRFLDTLNKKHKVEVEKIAFEHTKKILGTITVVFYDMTTLYFETEDEDDLRKIGFSKDGKFQCPQIMVGLLVGEGGFPIGYDVFEGNTFEGETLVPVLEGISKKYELGKPVVVADAAMLSKANVKELEDNKYTFIVGGRIKNETDTVKEEILKKSFKADGDSCEVIRGDGTRLIVTYKENRAKKDAHNREKGLKKLRARVETGKLTKTNITNRGYNKFLALDGEVKVTINEEKVESDKVWDGLKGYVTNTELPYEKVIEHYGHLWQIEKAFRISKTDLRIRPIYHYKRARIEAHLTIAFTAYCIWKELESLLNENKVFMSPKRAGELTHTMYALDYTLPQSKTVQRQILKMDAEQTSLYDVIHSQKNTPQSKKDEKQPPVDIE